MKVCWEMCSAPLGVLCTVQPSRSRGSPRCLILYADDRRLENSSNSSTMVAVILKSSMLIATNVAAVGVNLWNKHVYASDY